MATAEAEIDAVGLEVSEDGRFARILVSSPFLGLALALLTWPIISIVPTTGPDPSWAAGLYLAQGEGLQFGRDIVFTYGPLGFLEVPVLYEQTMWIIAFLYQTFIHIGLAVSLLWVARRALPLAVAVALCYCLLVVGRLEGAAVLLAFIWCYVALEECPPRFAMPMVTYGVAVLAAIELLAKANYGVAILGLGGIAVAGMSGRRRNAPIFVAVVMSVFLLLWVATGQDLSNVPQFVSRSGEVISGYSSAMGIDIAAIPWQRPASIAAMVLLLAGTTLATWRDETPRRLASLALVALFVFMMFKQGFVRQGLGNTPEFFVLVACAALTIAARIPKPRLRTPAFVGFVAPFVAVAMATVPSPSLWHSLKPQAHVEFMREGVDALLSRGERGRLIAESTRSMRLTYDLDPGIVRALGDRSVHIDPWEIGVAWAYGLNWHPLPVMQSYSAYTPGLDEMNAAALSGTAGPAAILRHRVADPGSGSKSSIDSRFPGWESPAAMRAMLCHYRAVRTISRWQLLKRVADRCGPPRWIGTVSSATGHPIPIPLPPNANDLVFAKIDGIGIEGWESLRAVLYRGPEREVTLDDEGNWKVIPATAGDGLILRVPPNLDYRAPFRLAPNSSTMSVGLQGSQRDIKSIFFAQRLNSVARETVRPQSIPRAQAKGTSPRG